LLEKLEKLTEEKEQFSAENEVMRVEIKSHLKVKQTTQEKLKQMKVEMGLTASESRHLIQVNIQYPVYLKIKVLGNGIC